MLGPLGLFGPFGPLGLFGPFGPLGLFGPFGPLGLFGLISHRGEMPFADLPERRVAIH